MNNTRIYKVLAGLLVAQSVFTATAFAATRAEADNAAVASISEHRLAVSGIDHVGINVPDVNAASAFFEKLLGAHVVSDMNPGKIPDAWKDKFRWHRSSEIQRIVMMQLQDGTKIELFQYAGPEISRSLPHEDDAAATHIALRTTDVTHSLAVLKAMRLRVLNDPITLPDGETWFYFLTPWGSQIELVFMPDKAATAQTGASTQADVSLPLAQRLIDTHFKIWNDTDPAARLAQFDAVYAPDLTVADYAGIASGFDDVNQLIGRVQTQHPGFAFTPDPVTWNHGFGRVTWGYGPSDKPNAVRGEDIFTIKNGRIESFRVFLDN